MNHLFQWPLWVPRGAQIGERQESEQRDQLGRSWRACQGDMTQQRRCGEVEPSRFSLEVERDLLTDCHWEKQALRSHQHRLNANVLFLPRKTCGFKQEAWMETRGGIWGSVIAPNVEKGAQWVVGLWSFPLTHSTQLPTGSVCELSHILSER